MPTIFIAVQCCQCSTMQVKQRKKSSNKWTCVVCNQKQSVLKVFSQSFMAKDVRKVVQTFNMSRQLADQNQSPLQFDEQTLASPSHEQTLASPSHDNNNQTKKRTDWTEYIDLEEEDNHNDDTHRNVFDEKSVTELPKPLFKKPKLSDHSSLSTGLVTGKRNENSYRPVFGKRSSSYKQLDSIENEPNKSGGRIVDPNKRACTKQAADMFAYSNFVEHRLSIDEDEPLHAAAIFAEKELLRCQSSKDAGASKWTDYMGEKDSNNNLAAKAPSKLGQNAGASSKWADYITKEDDNADLMIRSQKNHPGQWNDVAVCTTLYDQTAEDDIHPDFH